MLYERVMFDMFTILILLIAMVFAILVLIEHRNGEKIKKKTYQLRRELSDEKVEDYISFIDKIQVPHMKIYYDTLKAGYTLIVESRNIDNNLKEELRKIMLSRGILI